MGGTNILGSISNAATKGFNYVKDTADDALNNVRDASLSDREIKDRALAKLVLKVAQVVLVALAAISIFKFIAVPTVFSLCRAGIVTFIAHELYQVAGNIFEGLKKARIEGTISFAKIFNCADKKAFEQATKNTILLQHCNLAS